MGGGAAAHGQQATHAGGIQAGHIGGADIVHHQNIGVVGRLGQADVAKHAEHAAADIAQVGGAFGQQPVGQHLLGVGGGVDSFPPARFRRAAFADGVNRRLVQFGVVEHLFVHRENVGHFAAGRFMYQRLKLGSPFFQRCLQAGDLVVGLIGVLRIVELHRTNDEHRRNRQAWRGCYTGVRRVSGQRLNGGLTGASGWGRVATAIEGRDFLTQATLDGGGNGV